MTLILGSLCLETESWRRFPTCWEHLKSLIQSSSPVQTWRDCLVCTVPTTQVWRPKFHLQNSCFKKPSVMVHTWNPKAEKAETERVLGLTGQPSKLPGYFQDSKRLCLKKKGRIPGILSSFLDKLFSELHSTDILKPYLNIGNMSIEGI